MAPTLTAVPDADEAPETQESPVEAPQGDPETVEAPETTEAAPAAEKGKKSRAKAAVAKPASDDPKVHAPLAALPFDPLGLDLDKRMGFEEWADLVKGLMTIEEGHNWWLGDAVAFGEEKFAEQAFQVFGDDTLKYDPKTVANYASVSRSVPKSVRRAELSWSHHREVAPLRGDTRAQKRLLGAAVKEKLSCAELKLRVTAELPDNGAGAGVPEQKKRQQAYSVNFSVLADQLRIGQTVAELAGEFVMNALAERGVTPANFSIKGLPKVEETKRPEPEWDDESGEEPGADEV